MCPLKDCFTFGSTAVMVHNTDFFSNCTRDRLEMDCVCVLAIEVMQIRVFMCMTMSTPRYSLGGMRHVQYGCMFEIHNHQSH